MSGVNSSNLVRIIGDIGKNQQLEGTKKTTDSTASFKPIWRENLSLEWLQSFGTCTRRGFVDAGCAQGKSGSWCSATTEASEPGHTASLPSSDRAGRSC